MKKYIMIVMVLVSCGLYAIDYPTYKPVNSRYSSPVSSPVEQPVYGAYSTVATGGTTTFGEGSAISGYSNGPRRAPSMPGAYIGETKEEGDVTYVWNGSAWEREDDDTEEDPGNPFPVGDPILPMLLFALMAGGAIALRRRQAQA